MKSIKEGFCILRAIAGWSDLENYVPLEAAILRIKGDREEDCFSCLIDPGFDPPPRLCQLTGRGAEEYRRGLPQGEAAQKIRLFLGDLPLVLMDGEGPEAALLREGGRRPFTARPAEVRQLAWLCFPYLRDHSFASLASTLLGAIPSWKALEEARQLHRILERLLDAWSETPRRVRVAVLTALKEGGNPWYVFLSGSKTPPASYFPDLVDLLPRAESGAPEEARAAAGHAEERREGPVLDLEDIERLLAPGGPLSVAHGEMETRPQQVCMAREVAKALDDGAFLVVEAGTGVGKSLAYLIPGVLHAAATGSTLVVSTYTRNLQEQLFYRDLPLLSRALGSFDYALLKGRQNYLCLRKWSEWCGFLARGEPVLHFGSMTPAEGYAFLVSWMAGTAYGDLEEIAINLRLALAGVLEDLASRSEECLRGGCRFASRCFLERARTRAAASRVVVVNHALLLSQIAPTPEGPADLVLPSFRHLVVDEAHHLEDVATEAFSAALSLPDCLRLAEEVSGGKGLTGMLLRLCGEKGLGDGPAELDVLAERIRAASEDLFLRLYETLRAEESDRVVGEDELDRRRLTRALLAHPRWEECRAAAVRLADLLAGTASRVLGVRDAALSVGPTTESEELLLACRRAEVTAERMDLGANTLRTFFLDPDDEDFPLHLRWVERLGGYGTAENGPLPFRLQIKCAPMSVSEHLSSLLFRRLDSAILSSASLRAPGGREGFSFFLRRTGLDFVEKGGREVRLLCLDSPFDYGRQSLLLAVKDLPPPAVQAPAFHGYLREIRAVLEEVILAAGGRTLVLLTSHQQVEFLHGELSPLLERNGISCLRQRRGVPNALVLDRFREDRESVLLATEAFWEGVDVPGDSLSAVIMVKLPFRHPQDPVVAGRMERLEETGESGWYSYYLPLAVSLFRQGIGRLIRRSTDRGVVVILDPRFLKRSYSSAFRNALPPGMRVTPVSRKEVGEEVERFFAG